ncbi:MAG: peptidoglycan DD-metalloendopeptidase family protein, partial [Gammaproteobacteria bacterium]|nr:peptidoglycan DD-metalloendopeptidase family protein [Gammaproteobacteria bacterium]
LALCEVSYAALPKASYVAGGVVDVPLTQTTAKQPKAYLGKHRVAVVPYKDNWTAVVGVPLKTKPGTIYLTVTTAANKTEQIPLVIKAKKYPKSYITIKNKHLVAPTKSDWNRIGPEQKVIHKALKHWTSRNDINMAFIWPVKGRISTPFALQRFYNGKAHGKHRGLDIAVPTNTPIKAPAAGKVILAGNYFFMGNAVFIDHGQGLITVYCHMNKIKVKLHQKVKQGQIIGLVGQTGRATGPHLHWGVRLNGTPVDPALFVG